MLEHIKWLFWAERFFWAKRYCVVRSTLSHLVDYQLVDHLLISGSTLEGLCAAWPTSSHLVEYQLVDHLRLLGLALGGCVLSGLPWAIRSTINYRPLSPFRLDAGGCVLFSWPRAIKSTINLSIAFAFQDRHSGVVWFLAELEPISRL